MRIAVTGTTGRVGRALAARFSPKHEVIELPRAEFDLTNPSALSAALDRLECDVLFNPAGITALEACEADPALAMRVNAEAPAEIMQWAAKHGVRMIHFSTDYVFEGSLPGLRNEWEPTAPLNAYGRAKVAGERAVLDEGGTVVRVSWVFGPEKASFIDGIIESAQKGNPLAAVADKFSLPTFTTDLSGWMESLITSEECGTFHACNRGEPTTWHDFAQAALSEMHQLDLLPEIPPVEKQKLAEIRGFRAERPIHSAMASTRLEAILGAPPRDWRDALADYIRNQYASV